MDAWIKNWVKQCIQARHKQQIIIVSILALVVLVLLGLTGYTWARKDITITVDGKAEQVSTFKKQVGEVLKEKRIALNPKDSISYELETALQDGMVVAIERAFPVVIKVDGRLLKAETPPAKVEEILKQSGVTLGPEDQISPALGTLIAEPTKIVIKRIGYKKITKEVPIPFQIERKEMANWDRGMEKVTTAGQKGLERKIIKITYRDGVEVNRQVIDTKVVKKPVNKCIAYGTRSVVSRGGDSYRFRESLTVTATAYSATGNSTFSGTKPGRGTVAVDPGVIPLGSRLYVEGYGVARALDIGGAIQGNRIDVFMNSQREARRWGVRTVKVYLLE
ncbi:3D domain-containing protein [Bacillota bacterium LX-D]|nr:3D domain-containing protein [Bacillota bacterium LX-D]